MPELPPKSEGVNDGHRIYPKGSIFERRSDSKRVKIVWSDAGTVCIIAVGPPYRVIEVKRTNFAHRFRSVLNA